MSPGLRSTTMKAGIRLSANGCDGRTKARRIEKESSAKAVEAEVPQAMRIPGRLTLVAMMFPMVVGLGGARAQEPAAPDGVTQTAPTPEKPNPLKRRLSDRERIQQQKDLKQELRGDYKKWLD